MKSERRHELEQNSLAQWLASFLPIVRPYFNAILAAALIAAVGFIVYGWWSSYALARSSKAWDAYFNVFTSDASNPSDFEKVAEEYPRSDVAQWALLTAADVRLHNGTGLVFTNKLMAKQELGKAVDGYLSILGESSNPIIRERATFGLARARETQGDLAEARKSYEDLLKQWPQGAYASVAKERLDDLERQSTKEFYDKLAKAAPAPAAAPASVTPGPAFDETNVPKEPGAAKDAKAAPDKSAAKPAAGTPSEKGPAASRETKPPKGAEKPASESRSAKPAAPDKKSSDAKK